MKLLKNDQGIIGILILVLLLVFVFVFLGSIFIQIFLTFVMILVFLICIVLIARFAPGVYKLYGVLIAIIIFAVVFIVFGVL